MPFDEQTLRPAIETAFEQGGLKAIGRLVVNLLNEQEARHQAELAAMEARYQAVIAKLEARIAELEKRLHKNKPPMKPVKTADPRLQERNDDASKNAMTNGCKPGSMPIRNNSKRPGSGAGRNKVRNTTCSSACGTSGRKCCASCMTPTFHSTTTRPSGIYE